MKTASIPTAMLWSGFLMAAQGATVNFNGDPFAGSTALSTPGRQVNGLGELTLAQFDLVTDRFVFNINAFPNVGPLNFINSTLVVNGFNVIVLRDVDNDNNPATPFNAGLAANLIANQVSSDGAGFFLYFNSALSANRLVYSTNLNESNADLAILARISSPTGQGAINALPAFTAANFSTSNVPEPSSWLLSVAGLGLAWLRFRKR